MIEFCVSSADGVLGEGRELEVAGLNVLVVEVVSVFNKKKNGCNELKCSFDTTDAFRPYCFIS